MQPDHRKDPDAAALGQRGGQKRMAQLNARERSALSRYAARARWHPREAQVARERAQEITFLIREALRGAKQPPIT